LFVRYRSWSYQYRKGAGQDFSKIEIMLKAKDIKVGDTVLYGGRELRVHAISEENERLVFRFIRYDLPFCVREWDTFDPKTEIRVLEK
jgi:hypothetical protein